MNAIDMLKKDHRKVDSLFSAFESAAPGDHDVRRGLVKQIIHALRTHAAIEDNVFYPEVALRVDGPVKKNVADATHNHDDMACKLDALAVMSPSDEEAYGMRVSSLKEHVQGHVAEEENLFAHVRQTLSNHALKEVGVALVEDREFVDHQVSLTEAEENRSAGL